MSKIKILVHSQYYENYAVGPDGFDEVPYWKPKGGHEFYVEVDSDVLLYGEEQIEKVLSKMVRNYSCREESTIAEKFEYRGYEIQWGEPTLLNEKEFEMLLEFKDLP